MDSSVLFALAFKPTKSECCIVLLRTTARQGYRFIGCKSLLISLLLMISGDIETNPGPKCHFSCVSCSKAIRNSENSIGCTKCRKWTHLGCSALSYEEFQSLSDREWLCCACLQSYLPHSLLKDLTTDQKLNCLDNSLSRLAGSVRKLLTLSLLLLTQVFLPVLLLNLCLLWMYVLPLETLVTANFR